MLFRSLSVLFRFCLGCVELGESDHDHFVKLRQFACGDRSVFVVEGYFDFESREFFLSFRGLDATREDLAGFCYHFLLGCAPFGAELVLSVVNERAIPALVAVVGQRARVKCLAICPEINCYFFFFSRPIETE